MLLLLCYTATLPQCHGCWCCYGATAMAMALTVLLRLPFAVYFLSSCGCYAAMSLCFLGLLKLLIMLLLLLPWPSVTEVKSSAGLLG